MCVDALFTTDLEDAARMEGFAAIMDHAGIYKNRMRISNSDLPVPCNDHVRMLAGTPRNLP